ncbi:MAG: hypothetical protein IK016_06120 [Lachnospiraceae bacterium]|nr:hypothetical protein [Lachnospiraceae bacterium]
MKTLYEEIEKQLRRLDFGALWPGFHPLKFALYDDKEVFFDGRFVEKTSAFCANTAIEYEGEQIAIWNMEGEQLKDAEILTSKIVHEMFHAYQTKKQEARHAKELEAVVKYRYDAENFAAKMREGELLAELMKSLLEDGSAVPEQDALAEFLSLRALRRSRFSYEFRYEVCNEQIEGCANFVELECLRQLSEEKAAKGWARQIACLTDANAYFPVRPVCYAFGACLLKVLHARRVPGIFDFSEITFPELVLKDVAPADTLPSHPEMSSRTAAYLEETKRIVEDAVRNGDVVLEGDFRLVSPNIYDARYYDNHITSRFFVAYEEEGEMKQLRGPFFVILVDDDLRIKRVWKKKE